MNHEPVAAPTKKRRRGPGCGVVFLGLLVVILLPSILARYISAPLGFISFIVLLVGWFVLLYSIRGDARSFAFAFHTSKFPVEPEGDLVACNGMPGSRVVEHLTGVLKGRVDRIDKAIQEDYGWGCYCQKDGCRIWLAVSYASPLDGSRVLPAEWVISTTHERTLSPKQWIRSNLGLKVARNIHAELLAASRVDPSMKMLWAEES